MPCSARSPGRGRKAEGSGGRRSALGCSVVTGWHLLPGRPQSFAEETLRTLCLAYKKVDEDIYEEWRQRHEEASILLQNRAQALHQVYEEIEQNLQVGEAQEAWGLQHAAPACCGTLGLPHIPGLAGSLLSLFSVSAHHPASSCWESQPLKTSSRTVSLKPSSVSSEGTSKCGYSRGTSKVGPRLVSGGWERIHICPERHHQTFPLVWVQLEPLPCPGEGRNEMIGTPVSPRRLPEASGTVPSTFRVFGSCNTMSWDPCYPCV